MGRSGETRTVLGGRSAKLTALLLSLAAAGLAPMFARAAAPAAGAGDVAAGHAIYAAKCAACHGPQLQGGFGPELDGADFRNHWQGKDAALQQFIVKNMPPSDPELTPEMGRQLVAFLRDARTTSANAPMASQTGLAGPPPVKPGSHSAGSTEEIIGDTFEDDAVSKVLRAKREDQLTMLSPVTEATLDDPKPDEWPTWRRSHAGQGYSPLTEVTSGNVAGLRLAWAFNLQQGTNQFEPLEHDGVLYVNSKGEVTAFDAATGDRLWQFNEDSGPGFVPVSQPRNMALWGTMLYVPTNDARMIALDARTGKKLWEHAVAPATDHLQMTGGPIVVKGKILQGVSGCADVISARCFIVALDGQTGRELWRFNTIARHDEPGGDSWNGAADKERFGGSVWDAGSYDPTTNLVYFGVAQTYHIAPLLTPLRPAGPGNAGLYTNTTLAFDPDTGKLVWHYQHFTRDVWDFDWAFERTLFSAMIKGKQRRVVATVGKLGIIDLLDAKTGEYLVSYDLGLQTLVKSIDPKTGEKIVDARQVPQPNVPNMIRPSPFGVRNWMANAFDPTTNTLFVNEINSCSDFDYDPSNVRDQRLKAVRCPDTTDGMYGAVIAINLVTGKTTWSIKRRAPASSAVVATAGGLIFEGAADRYFNARDSRTGKILWQTRLPQVPNSYPITYRVKGRQYIAVITGGGGVSDAASRQLMPEVATPARGNTVMVFGLPEPAVGP